MAGKSKILSHPNRVDIDRALIENESLRDIARRFGLKKDAILRYKHSHFPERLAKADELKEIGSVSERIEQIEELATKARKYMQTAEDEKNIPLALSAMREARANIEVLLKVAGQLREKSIQVGVQVILQPAVVNKPKKAGVGIGNN